MLLHIHGFNSSPASNTFRMLHAVFPQARALAYPCDGLFADNLAALRAQAVALYQEALRGQALAGQNSDRRPLVREFGEFGEFRKSTESDKSTPLPLVISGSSLGGFYASQVAALLHADAAIDAPCHCALFNPVVFPAHALRPFLGRNTLFHSGEVWEFTPAMLESYARFTDTRCASSALRRFVLLGCNDSLLNPDEARTYWQHCAMIHETDDEHSLAALDAVTVSALRDLGADA